MDPQPHRRKDDMVCADHSNMMKQLETLNNHFSILLHPETGILVQQKIKIDRLESFKRVQIFIASAIGLPILGALGMFIWTNIRGN